MSKNVVITILGIQNAKFEDDIFKIKDYHHQAHYYFDGEVKTTPYYNTFPLLIEKYAKNYTIKPIYTQEARIFNEEVLNYAKLSCDFDDETSLIKDESKYDKIFSLIDSLIQPYDKVIIDLTHGFRHLPLLAIIDLVIHNFKNNNKIEKILFAKEIIKHTPKEIGEYEIIDLKEYLDIANLSFIISNFKDNYTISSLAQVSNKKYNQLLVAMKEFSRDILALSMQHFFHTSLPALNKALDDISEDFILKSDLNELQEHLKTFDFKEKKRYQIYFETAKELMKKEYILQSVNLLHEAKRFYVKTSFKNKSEKNYFYIDEIENKIDKEPDNYKNNIYQLLSECIYIYSKSEDYLDKKRLMLIDINKAKSLKNSIQFNKKFKEFLQDDLRNKLSHANSDEEIKNVKSDLEENIEQFEKFCIDDDILGN